MESSGGKLGKFGRAGLNVASGAIPFVGGLLSAAAGYWSEAEQEHANNMLRQWIQMLEDELREKGKTIAEVMARLNMKDEEVSSRIESEEYQSILKKAFRNWSSIDSESKREKIRNILANAAATRLTSDDVVKLFIDWIDLYSDFHFEVIGEIYRKPGVTRGAIWRNLNKPAAREDSAEADLYKLLVRDLSMGGVIRQHRETDYYGNFVKKQTKSVPKGSGSRTMVSAFDNEEGYELTDLGKQFVHYAMTELTPRIAFSEFKSDEPIDTAAATQAGVPA
ncbi:MAG TPA: hypothetical protein VGC56_15240 [Allosphingosinicella sp.]|jgi:hypothetical protein